MTTICSIITICLTLLTSSSECQNIWKTAEKQREDCLDTGRRFDSDDEWNLAGTVSVFHCLAPIAFAILFWVISSLFNKKPVNYLKIPIPIVTKLYKTILEWRLFLIYTRKVKEKES